MTDTITIVWQIEPVTPPRPLRHCSTCGCNRVFHSSGKIRLNANGQRLDAWLIYKCSTCEKTRNRPLVQRAAVTSIAKTDLLAMHVCDPAWVRLREFDLATLGRHATCDKIDISLGLSVTKIMNGEWPEAWSVIDLAINAQHVTGMRLDRLLASELGLARSEQRSMQHTGGLQFDSDSGRMLRKPVVGSFAVRFVAFRLTESQRAALSVRTYDLRP